MLAMKTNRKLEALLLISKMKGPSRMAKNNHAAPEAVLYIRASGDGADTMLRELRTLSGVDLLKGPPEQGRMGGSLYELVMHGANLAPVSIACFAAKDVIQTWLHERGETKRLRIWGETIDYPLETRRPLEELKDLSTEGDEREG
jgi:hypothetical protein